MIVSPDKELKMDGTALRIAELINSKYPIIPLTRINDFIFNTELLKLKEYILLDYCEYGANDWDHKETHIFGKNTGRFQYAFNSDEWYKFDEFVMNNPPLLHFKRELLQKDVIHNLLPVEYPCFYTGYPTLSRTDFDNKPLEVFFSWGHSNESRRMLHGEIWKNAAKKGYSVCDNIYYFNKFMEEETNPHKWVTMNIPHYGRQDLTNILTINGAAKLSLSLWGAGVKCFRSSESPINSVMVLPMDDLAWTYEWISGINCVRIPLETDLDSLRGITDEVATNTIETLETALKCENLYNIYLNGLNTIEKYRVNNYIPYLEKLINNA